MSDYVQPTSADLNDRSTQHGTVLNNVKYGTFRLTARCGLEVISCPDEKKIVTVTSQFRSPRITECLMKAT